LLLVDDHPVFRQGLVELLNLEPGLEVVGEAESGEAGVEMAGTLHPDVVIMDVMLPGMGGIEATRRIHSLYGDTRVLLLSAQEPASMAEAMEVGARGYLSKTVTPEKLVAAVRAVVQGGHIFYPATSSLPLFAPAASDPLRALTGKEREVLSLAAQGLTAAEIGKKLFLSPKTVETYRSRALRKLGLETRAELVAFAQRTGILRG
jgi:DNA-binding NarL/FixJ family response regulator